MILYSIAIKLIIITWREGKNLSFVFVSVSEGVIRKRMYLG